MNEFPKNLRVVIFTASRFLAMNEFKEPSIPLQSKHSQKIIRLVGKNIANVEVADKLRASLFGRGEGNGSVYEPMIASYIEVRVLIASDTRNPECHP